MILFVTGLISSENSLTAPEPVAVEGAAQIPAHKLDKTFTISTSTDTIGTNYATGEICAFKYNIEPTVMWGSFLDMSRNITAKDSGRLDFADYFQHFRWRVPGLPADTYYTNKYKEIPSYKDTTWNAEAETFFPVTAGAAKTRYAPYHGQSLYDLTAGQYGYDYVNNVMGASNMAETEELYAFERQEFYAKFGRYPSVFAYSYYTTAERKKDAKVWRDKFLYGRWTTEAGIGQDAYTNYASDNSLGESKGKAGADFFDMDLSHRYEQYTPAQVQAYMNAQLPKTQANRGWFHTFGHWHGVGKDEIENAFALHYHPDAACISIRKAIEHWIFRENYKVETTLAGNTITVQVVLDKAYEVNHTLLTADVSIKLDLTDTPLEGAEVSCPTASLLLKKAANVFLIEHPLTNPNGFSFQVQAGAGQYDTLTLPVVQSATASGTTVTIQTDVPTKLALFVVARDGSYLDATLLTRSNSLQTSHQVTISTTDQAKDVYVAAITKARQSVLSDVVRLL